MASLLRPFSVPGSDHVVKLVGGRGSYVSDYSGRTFLDAAGGLWNVALGLGDQGVIARMRAQMETLAYAPLFDGTHPLAEALAERLIGLSGGSMQFAYLSTTGSSAVEAALTTAQVHFHLREKPAKRRVLAFDRGYHGSSYQARAASGIMHQELAALDLALPNYQLIPSPHDETHSLEVLRHLLATDGDQVCCLLMEPILGSGGIIVPSRTYCQTVSQLCREYDVLLIADEVATGGGRCGGFFASNLLGLEPDVITLSKGLTAGYFPVGATLFARHVIEPFSRQRVSLPFGSTQDGNPVGCAAASATIDFIEQGGLMERACLLGHRIGRQLSEHIHKSVVAEVRGMGLMIGIELRHQGNGGSHFTEGESAQVRHACREEGLLVYHFDSGISLFPPLTLSDAEADEMLEILGYVFSCQT